MSAHSPCGGHRDGGSKSSETHAANCAEKHERAPTHRAGDTATGVASPPKHTPRIVQRKTMATSERAQQSGRRQKLQLQGKASKAR
jgi:hypothetical protein